MIIFVLIIKSDGFCLLSNDSFFEFRSFSFETNVEYCSPKIWCVDLFHNLNKNRVFFHKNILIFFAFLQHTKSINLIRQSVILICSWPFSPNFFCGKRRDSYIFTGLTKVVHCFGENAVTELALKFTKSLILFHLILSLTYFVVHPIEDVWHGRDHSRLEQPDVVVEESHVARVETDWSADK